MVIERDILILRAFVVFQKTLSGPTTLLADISLGYQGNETDLWAQAAGMYNFDTFHVRCTRALESHDFIWPDGVDSVTFSSSTNYTVKKPGT